MSILKASFILLTQSLVLLPPVRDNNVGDPTKPNFLNIGVKTVKTVILQSVDHGNTWQDISHGLPANLENTDFIANSNSLTYYSAKEVFHKNANILSPGWQKAYSANNIGNISVCKSGIYSVKYDGKISKFDAKTNLWSTVFPNFPTSGLRTVFETESGAFLVGTDSGLFRSTDGGNTWQNLLKGWVIKIVESGGVLVATSQSGIVRSTDDGQTWEKVISEGGVGIDVAVIKGGFAAISYNGTSKTRRVRTSYDAGKTWQTIDAGLPPHDLIANVLELDNSLFVGHPNGIYKSSDKGISWTLVNKAIDDKVFNLYVSDKTIYAIPRAGGC